jgi:hypothetical protein
MPLTKKVFEDFYIQDILNVNIEVEYWDITKIFFKNVYEQEDSSVLCKTKIINFYNELEREISIITDIRSVLFVSIMTFEGRLLKLHQILTKYNCTVSIFGRNIFPMTSQNSKSLTRYLEKLTFTKIKNYLLTKQICQSKDSGKIKFFDIIFLGGSMGWKGIGYIKNDDIKKSEIIKINSNDYDNFMSLKNSNSVLEYKYILFLDEYLPFHPDMLLFKIKNVKPEQYYPELNSYFNRVEKQFGLPIVIAAHPKAIKYKTQNFFNGRKVIFNQTSQLSEHADFVIAHDTTSINYPIAFGKKLHFITSTNIFKHINTVHQNVLMFADFLGCNVQWFDKSEKLNLINNVPLERYDNYKYLFQTSLETENKLSKDIVVDFLLNT